jgi:serine/threonine-protein phosphatase 6 regulatory ankyrin repeat subunit B
VKGANEFGATALYAAAELSDPTLAIKLLAAGADPNMGLLSGETPLMQAARRGNVAIVRALLSAKADPNAKETHYGHTALMAAISQRHAPVVEELLRGGAQVDLGARSGFTPLMYAAQQGDVDITRILLGAGANVNFAQPQFGMTPLIIASAMVFPDVVDLLLQRGADPNAANFRGYNPLLYVVRDGDHGIDLKGKEKIVHIVKALLKAGADPNFRLKQASKPSSTITEVELNGASPLVLAGEVNNTEAIKAMLEAGANPNITTEKGTTALILASGAGTDIQRMRTPEERAAALETVKLLLDNGVDVNAAGQFGWTAIHAAAYQGLPDVIQYLVSKGADINKFDNFGQTPLSISMAVLTKGIEHRRPQIPRRYRRDIVELILKLGATPLDKSGVEVVMQRTGDLELGREVTNEQ